jgi:hypothetical protein
MRVPINATGEAKAELSRLVLEQVITSFETNFHSSKELGFVPQVSVWIEAQDERAMERARRQVLGAIDPFIKGAAVTVYPKA